MSLNVLVITEDMKNREEGLLHERNKVNNDIRIGKRRIQVLSTGVCRRGRKMSGHLREGKRDFDLDFPWKEVSENNASRKSDVNGC